MSPASGTILSARGLSKFHGQGLNKVHALNHVDIDVHAGDLTVICGPSGSGKSTLLNMLGLLDPPDSGSITIDGAMVHLQDATALERLRRERFGFVFQNFNLVPVLTAVENVELPLYVLPMKAAQRRARATELLEAVGLADRLHHRPSELSGGQQQRVAIARALVRSPLLVFADEPTANLDSITSEHLLDLVIRLNVQFGTAFVVATHDPRVIHRARRVCHIADGVLQS